MLLFSFSIQSFLNVLNFIWENIVLYSFPFCFPFSPNNDCLLCRPQTAVLSSPVGKRSDGTKSRGYQRWSGFFFFFYAFNLFWQWKLTRPDRASTAPLQWKRGIYTSLFYSCMWRKVFSQAMAKPFLNRENNASFCRKQWWSILFHPCPKNNCHSVNAAMMQTDP